MLHQDVLMADIDVDQWRNAQSLLLRSAKSCPRLVVIHDKGRVVKFRHSRGMPVHGHVDSVADPHRLARDVYEANKAVVDFAVVLDRDSVDSYFAQVQDGWDIDDDLDAFVQKTYAALDSYPDGIVTYPGRARDTLGLQWRIGASHDQVVAAVRELVAPQSTVVLGVSAEDRLWASLILDFDDDANVTSITTADPSAVDLNGTHEELTTRLSTWVEKSGKTVSFAMVLDRDAATEFLAARAEDKKTTLLGLLTQGRGSLGRAPAALMAASR